MADVPWLGASANLTFLGISVLKTSVEKVFFQLFGNLFG
jgi:hypothetical protein